MLSIQKVSKSYGNRAAIKNITLEIKDKELFCLIGPNGSGKTTLIKTVLGLLRPTTGKISVDGNDIQKLPEKAKSLMGYIPDEPTGWNNVTGEEFLHIVGALYGVGENERRARIPKLLKIFNLAEASLEYFEDYSRGNKQKFAILAALLHKPKLLLIDEPIVGLDPISAITAKEIFKDFAKKEGSILMATHTLPVAQEIATKIGILQNGHLKFVGTMSELRKEFKLAPATTLEDAYEQVVGGN